MYYISNDNGDRTFTVVDTLDNVAETYTIDEIQDFINRGIEFYCTKSISAIRVFANLQEIIDHFVALQKAQGKMPWDFKITEDGFVELVRIAEDGFVDLVRIADDVETASELIIPEFVTYMGNHIFGMNRYTPIIRRFTKIALPYGLRNIAPNLCCNSNITEVHIPETVETIGECAFSNCKYLRSIEIPDSVVYIGNKCFSSCKNLKSVRLSNALQNISIECFSYCSSLKEIIIPDTVEQICTRAFIYCDNLSVIKLPKSLNTIGMQAFAATGITEIDLSNVLFLDEDCFKECKKLKSVKLSEKLYMIPKSCFEGCVDLVEINLENILVIRGYAFRECVSLESLNMPKVECINVCAFSECIGLKEVNIPSAKYIYNLAFFSCANLRANFSHVKFIASSALNGTPNILTATISSDFEDAINHEFNKFNTRRMLTGKKPWKFKIKPTRAISVEIPEEDKCGDIEIPKYVKVISAEMFKNTEITSIKLPDTLLAIEAQAFAGCSKLKEIIIPDSVVFVGGSAFARCESLERVKFSRNLTYIDTTMIANFHLKEVNAEGIKCLNGDSNYIESLEKLTFDKELRCVTPKALLHTNLKEVTIPSDCVCTDESFSSIIRVNYFN